MKLSLTVQCILGLVVGVVAGVLAGGLDPAAIQPWLTASDSVIRLWTNALRLVVTPLIVAQLFVAISGHRGAKADAARLGLLIPSVFLGLLTFTALVAIVAGLGLLTAPVLGDLSLAEVHPAPVAGGGTGAATGPVAWIDELVPSNLFRAASSDSILGLMIFSLAFAIAARRLSTELQAALDTGFRAMRDAMFVLVSWLLRVAPLTLLALAFRSASSAGLELGQMLLGFIGLAVVVTLLCTAALYPLATLGGRVPLGRFARALFPAQITAVTTRSSLASVPPLLRESDLTLGVPQKVSALVIPLGGAMLKLSRAVTNPLKLIFLAHLLGIALAPKQVAIFMVTIFLLSPTTVGVPSVLSGSRSIPAYVAAGIPPEYVILLGATTSVIDIALTLLNTTGYMTANVLVARWYARFPGLVHPTAEGAAEVPAPTAAAHEPGR